MVELAIRVCNEGGAGARTVLDVPCVFSVYEWGMAMPGSIGVILVEKSGRSVR